MTGKTDDPDSDSSGAPGDAASDSSPAPFGRNRAEAAAGETRTPTGPSFASPPPAHPLLTRMHSMWIEATPDSIHQVVGRARELAEGAPEEIQEWAVRYVEALERLEFWLRDF